MVAKECSCFCERVIFIGTMRRRASWDGKAHRYLSANAGTKERGGSLNTAQYSAVLQF
jgi:hypothetical protein